MSTRTFKPANGSSLRATRYAVAFCLLSVGGTATVSLGQLLTATPAIANDAAEMAELKAAAATKEQWAMYNYGKALLEGKGTQKDAKAAAELFAASAALGNNWAQFNLGELYMSGEGVSVDPWKAAELFASSAAQGNPWAQYRLADMKLDGSQIPQDLPKAKELFEKSAAQNNHWAQLKLGQMYVDGLGVKRSLPTGRALIEKSATQGNLFAKVALANIIYPTSPSKATALLREAAQAGNELAKQRLKELKR